MHRPRDPENPGRTSHETLTLALAVPAMLLAVAYAATGGVIPQAHGDAVQTRSDAATALAQVDETCSGGAACRLEYITLTRLFQTQVRMPITPQ